MFYLQAKKSSRVISTEWRALPVSQRCMWEDAAKLDRMRYKTEMALYQDASKGDDSDDRKLHTNAKPKKPVSAYLSFANSRRSTVARQFPSATNVEISKILSRMWKKASQQDRQEYIDIEAISRKSYHQALKTWQESVDSSRFRLPASTKAAKSLERPASDSDRQKHNSETFLETLCEQTLSNCSSTDMTGTLVLDDIGNSAYASRSEQKFLDDGLSDDEELISEEQGLDDLDFENDVYLKDLLK